MRIMIRIILMFAIIISISCVEREHSNPLDPDYKNSGSNSENTNSGSAQFFPLAVGYEWQYEAEINSSTWTIDLEIFASTYITLNSDSLKTYAMSSYYTSDLIVSEEPELVGLWYNSPNGVHSWGDQIEEEYLGVVFKYPVTAGEEYTGNEHQIKCLSTNYLLNTPAGNFECYVYEWTSLSGSTEANGTYYIAPGIGMVGFVDYLPGETVFYKLTSCSLVKTGDIIIELEPEEESEPPNSPEYCDLVGKWQAYEEKFDLTDWNLGKIIVTAASPGFINMIVDLKDDSTMTYESWTGSDKDAEDAGYSSETGTWTVADSTFSFDFTGEQTTDIEGTYTLSGCTLEISTSMILSDFGSTPVPMKITMERTN